MKKSGSSFEADYPAISRWVQEFGKVEIGFDDATGTFVQAIDAGGMPWSGKSEYKSIDAALRDLEKGITECLVAQRIAQRSSPQRRLTKRATPKTRKSPAKASKQPSRSEEEKKIVRKIEKLDRLAEELREGGRFSTTRLSTVKSLCNDPKAAGAFAWFLSRHIQKRMRAKKTPKRYRELVNRAVRELKPYLDEPTKEREERLSSLFSEFVAEQNEYENIPFGVLRNIKSMDLVVVEHALKSVLWSEEATFWLYRAARDYTGHTDELIRQSAPMVEEIAGFWRRHYRIKRR